MSQSEQIAFAQAMEHPQQVQPKPDQAKGAKSRLFQQGSRPIFTYTEAMKTRAGEKKLSLYRTNFEDAGVAGDYVLPPSTGYSAPMKKTVLGVAMVVVFCFAWWIVAGEAMQIAQQASQAFKQASQAFKQAVQAYQPVQQAYQQAAEASQQAAQAFQQAAQQELLAGDQLNLARKSAEAYQQAQKARNQASQALGQAVDASQQAAQAFTQAKQAFEPARQAERQAYLVFDQARSQSLSTEHPLGRAHLLAQQQAEQAEQAKQQAKAKAEQTEQASQQAAQAFIMADAHWRTQGSWGIGAGLLADVLLLVGALAWSKLTAKA